MIRPVVFLLLAAALGACSEQQVAAVPDAIAMTEEAVGHYCQMIVLEHPGPKAQVHLAGIAEPLWFSQVRDAFVFDRLPEETAEVAAIYVNDMGASESWETPGIDNWIAAGGAVYVVGSSRRGGMGAPEFVPFSSEAAARAFAAEYGGSVIGYDAITDAMVLEPVEVEPAPTHEGHAGQAALDGPEEGE
jgi:copper chaperone NosL